MNASELLQWQYMIFLLPMAIAALLLLLSSVKLGHRGGHASHGGHAGHGHGHGGSHPAPAHTPQHAHGGAKAAHPAPHAKTHTAPAARKSKSDEVNDKPQVTIHNNFVWNLSGLNRAPLPMVAQAFFLVWGLCGYWANKILIHTANIAPERVLPSVAIALVGGLVGARIAAEIIGRMMPEDESQVVSQEGLYGMVGKVAFPVSETSGRIHVYDHFGTLHDEMCRVETGKPLIERGRRAMVIDRDASGKLIVEETN